MARAKQARYGTLYLLIMVSLIGGLVYFTLFSLVANALAVWSSVFVLWLFALGIVFPLIGFAALVVSLFTALKDLIMHRKVNLVRLLTSTAGVVTAGYVLLFIIMMAYASLELSVYRY